MRLVMFGTGPFAVPTFQSLVNSSHEVVALVTRPILDSGKRRKTAENPTRDAGIAAGIPILDPPSANDADFVKQLEALQADLFVVCDYGRSFRESASARQDLVVSTCTDRYCRNIAEPRRSIGASLTATKSRASPSFT